MSAEVCTLPPLSAPRSSPSPSPSENLGALKGNKGDQNYVLPADVDPAEYMSVSIWCDRFDVSFGAAGLALPDGFSTQGVGDVSPHPHRDIGCRNSESCGTWHRRRGRIPTASVVR